MVSCLQASIKEALLFFSGPATFPASSSTFQKLSTPPGAYEGLGRTACNNLNIVTKKECPFVAGKSPGGVSARGHPGESEGEQSGRSACRRRRALHLWGERIGFNADIQRGF